MYKLVKVISQTFDDGTGVYSYTLFADNRVLERVEVIFDKGEFTPEAKELLNLATNIQLNYFGEFAETVTFLPLKTEACMKFFCEIARRERDNMSKVGGSIFKDMKKSGWLMFEVMDWKFEGTERVLDEEKLQKSLLLFTGGNESTLSKLMLEDVYPDINLQTFSYEETHDIGTNRFGSDHTVTGNFAIKRYLTAFSKPFNKSVVMFTYLPVLLIYATIVAQKKELKTLLVGDEWDRSVHDEGFYGQAFDQSDFMKLAYQETLEAMGMNMQVGSVVANLNTTLIMSALYANYRREMQMILSCFTPKSPTEFLHSAPCQECSKCHRMSFILTALGIDPTFMGLPEYSCHWRYDAESLFSSIGCQEEFETLNYLLKAQGNSGLGVGIQHKSTFELRDTPYNVKLPSKLEDHIRDSLNL